MATIEHWEVTDEKEMWQKLVGHDAEDTLETRQQANVIFDGVSGGSCLEIGAGVGRLLLLASHRFTSAIGIDYSRSMVQRSSVYLHDVLRARVVLTDGLEFPFASNSFDFVYSFTCFQHMPTIEIVQANIREIFRVLKDSGLCRVQTIHGEPNPYLYDGLAFPTAESFLQEFLDVGFSKQSAEVIEPWIWVTVKKRAK